MKLELDLCPFTEVEYGEPEFPAPVMRVHPETNKERRARLAAKKPTVDSTLAESWCSTCQESTPQSYVYGTERYGCYVCRMREWEGNR